MKLIPSPCKSICKMKDNVCIGCKRTTEEIATWSKLTNEQKQIIVDRIKQST
jgi:predicted Fe-S protein YdhL (DUF1289 family)